MTGGNSQILIGSLNLPLDIIQRLKAGGLVTAQDIIDERKAGLVTLGIPDNDISVIDEIIDKETGYRLD